MKKFVCLTFISSLILRVVSADETSFFVTSNSSFAVVIDEEYMRKININISATIKKTIDDIVRENLKHAGLNVKYFSWIGVHLKRDYVAAITVSDCRRTWNFFNAISLNSILHLAITDTECPRLPANKGILMPILTSGQEMPQIVLDMRIQEVLNWDRTVLLYDSGYDNEITSIIHSLSVSTAEIMKPLSVYVFKIEEITNANERYNTIKQSFEKLRGIKKKKFIVLAQNIKDILIEAEKFKYLDVYNEWLLFIQNPLEISKVREITQDASEGSNIAFAVNKTNSNCKLSALCAIQEMTLGFVTIFSKVIYDESSLFGQISDEEWETLRMTKEERLIEMISLLRKFLKKHNECSACMKWSLESTLSWGYSVQKDRRNDTERKDLLHTGSWIPIFGYTLKDVLFPNHEHKFRNMSVNIMSYHNPPWQILIHNDQNVIIQQSGIVIELLKELSSRLNFSYTIDEITSERDNLDVQNIETKLPGTLTNYIHPKLKTRTNINEFLLIAIATTANVLEKFDFDYSFPISVQSYTFITKRPEEVSRLYLFTAPFTTETWACLASITLVIGPFLFLINKFLPLEELKTVGLLKMKNCFWYIYGALLQQGGLYLPKADSGRLIIGIWWIGVIVLVTTYCGNLVAFLTFPNLQPGINYFFEIFQHDDIKTYGLRNGTYFEQYLKHTTRNDFKRAASTATFYGDTIEEDIKSVEKGTRINIDWKVNLKLTIQKQFEQHKTCTFVLGKEEFLDEQISIIIPTESPYYQVINDEIYRLHQTGFIDKWHKEYLTTSNKCDYKAASRQAINHKVNLKDMQGCFLVLMIGLMVSVGLIGFEFLIDYCLVGRKRRAILHPPILQVIGSNE